MEDCEHAKDIALEISKEIGNVSGRAKLIESFYWNQDDTNHTDFGLGDSFQRLPPMPTELEFFLRKTKQIKEGQTQENHKKIKSGIASFLREKYNNTKQLVNPERAHKIKPRDTLTNAFLADDTMIVPTIGKLEKMKKVCCFLL